MHDVAQTYYDAMMDCMDRHRVAVQALNEQLAADLLALKVAFDAEWVRRIRDFRGERAPEEKQEDLSTQKESHTDWKPDRLPNVADGPSGAPSATQEEPT